MRKLAGWTHEKLIDLFTAPVRVYGISALLLISELGFALMVLMP